MLASVRCDSKAKKEDTATTTTEEIRTDKDTVIIRVPVETKLIDTVTITEDVQTVSGSIFSYDRPFITSVSFSEQLHQLWYVEARVDSTDKTIVTSKTVEDIGSFHLTTNTNKQEAEIEYNKPILPKKRLADFYVETRVSYNLQDKLKLSIEPTWTILDRFEVKAEACVRADSVNFYDVGVGIAWRWF
ncbi:hypothetical protein GF338_04240 [candidate division WOR-3 bacterium]|nr:hypothetical protein [candidate division WOR-3 bacterium]